MNRSVFFIRGHEDAHEHGQRFLGDFDADAIARRYVDLVDAGQAPTQASRDAVTAWLQTWADGRKGAWHHIVKWNRDDFEERELRDGLDAWKLGFAEGMSDVVGDEVWDTFVDLAYEDDDEDEDDDELPPRPPRQNPGGAEPLSYWDAQGTWDSKHGGIDEEILRELIEPAAEALAAADTIDPVVVRSEAKRIAELAMQEAEQDDAEAGFYEQHSDELEDFNHLPSEAYRHWRAAFVAAETDSIMHRLEREARALRY